MEAKAELLLRQKLVIPDLQPGKQGLGLSRDAPCLWQRAIPTILPAARAQRSGNTRNALGLSPRPAAATSARFHRQHDEPPPRTTFPWLPAWPPLTRQR